MSEQPKNQQPAAAPIDDPDVNQLLEAAALGLERAGMLDSMRIVRGMKPGYPKTAPAPADERATTFEELRDRCEHYHGFKDETDDTQCTCPGNNHPGSWCEESDCPRRSRASSANETRTEGATERALSETIDERDRAEEDGTRLAEAVGNFLGVDVGAWSSANNPILAAIEALESRAPAHASEPVAIPAGYALVPIEPTPEMSSAGFVVPEAEHDPAGVYRAMIASAPRYQILTEEGGWLDVPQAYYERFKSDATLTRAITAAPPPPAPASYDGNHVENHCPECSQYESECECAPASAPIDVDAMLRACVPGGDICDPQRIADAIREWFDEHGAQASAPVGLTDDAVLVPKRVVELLRIVNRDGIIKRASELQEVYRLIDTARTGDEHADQA
ncbi:hypothetical protein KDW37_33625 [Burkholderia cenocepacia]|uniref:hypothetical protein n=1 Tax=Burkholderia cenocepacia TaxID=95486 RepID=UPI001B9DEBB6|nr:hypothetical protein [Burkholderia cenocepacia]MBR8435702.1 hypothetical protein [Burkholderia cenocepacia]